jgi:hypothetical protein
VGLSTGLSSDFWLTIVISENGRLNVLLIFTFVAYAETRQQIIGYSYEGKFHML